jgi:phosphotransferase system enzyme I (PtsI)
LLGKAASGLHAHSEPHIIIAHNPTPSDTALLNRSLVLGFCTEVGSKTSHTAIMARSLGIPATVGLHDVTSHITAGDPVLIDGYRGILIVNPSPQTIKDYESYEKEKDAVEERLELIRDTFSATSDGIRITLSANIELPSEMSDVKENGAEGVGLYRTEFLFLNREKLPDEEEQFENYRIVAEQSAPHSVIIRTLDIGGDKVAASLDQSKEENPFLGCRAIRFCLEHPHIFKTQLRAILRASVHGHLRLMYPMISGLAEFRQASAILEECKAELRSEGKEFDEKLEVGVMIEVPSAALVADVLAKEVKFFSIGTNDLIQYTIAVDRVNDRIAHLYKPTHPAILRLIKMVVEAARENGIWTGVCGEMAGDIVLTPLLLGLGIDELSTSPTLVPRVKKAVQSVSLIECQQLAERSLKANSSSDILQLCVDFARSRYDELVS